MHLLHQPEPNFADVRQGCNIHRIQLLTTVQTRVYFYPDIL